MNMDEILEKTVAIGYGIIVGGMVLCALSGIVLMVYGTPNTIWKMGLSIMVGGIAVVVIGAGIGRLTRRDR